MRRFVILLKTSLSLLTVIAMASLSAAERDPQLIERENAKPGATDWQLTRVRLDSTMGFRSPWIEGYCSKQSVKPGEALDIMVSTDPPQKFHIEIFRMGYYGGRGARLMTTLGPFQGEVQPTPPIGEKNIRECLWKATARLEIPADWPSGVYLGRMSLLPPDENTGPWQSYVIFIVRDQRPADILFQCSDNTWQAYNRWPDDYSLYIDPGNKHAWSSTQVDASFDRPYGKYVQIFENPQSVGSGEFLLWEYPLCYWLEQNGYDVTYCSNRDLTVAGQAARCKVFISVGHDEYWDLRQYETVKKATESGTSALFLSGNSVCYVTPFRPGSDGRPDRIISRKGPFKGLTMGGHELAAVKHAWVGPDEGFLIGARNILPVNGGGDWVVSKPEHWMFAGTDMRKGDRIPGLVGWEFHGDPPPIPGLQVVAQGVALHGGTKPTPYAATIYPGPKGGFVFNASTIFWAQGLSSPPGHMLPWSHNTRPHGPDDRVIRMTHNLLQRAIRTP